HQIGARRTRFRSVSPLHRSLVFAMLKGVREAPMRWIGLLLITLTVILLPSRADALTVRDVVELTRAGLGEEVLLALIEVDRSIFPIDAATIKELKASGVSERVITAMVRSGREVPSTEPAIAEVAPPVVPQ